MIEVVSDVAPETLDCHSAIIDVRSPSEFAADHIPGAINLPVLSDTERAEVGTIYKQDSRFRARRIGAAYVARNVAAHLVGALAGSDAKFRPLIYCWRGGMRSNAMATILSQIGWRVGVLEGGYKTWRRTVVRTLFDEPVDHKFILIDGETGAAKTEVIRRLPAHGVQTIDLEGLAAHKGSVFGGEIGRKQPTQKFFESLLFDTLRRTDFGKPVAIEAESSRIGALNIPKSIWTAMRLAPRVRITAPVEVRAEYVVNAYADFICAPNAVSNAIDRLKPFHSKEEIDGWRSLNDRKDYVSLAAALMQGHYDPAYARSARKEGIPSLENFSMDELSSEDIDCTAKAIAGFLSAHRW